MRNILYLNNYMSKELLDKRDNESVYSQSANNKIQGLVSALSDNDCKVTILSSGLVNNRTFRYYKPFTEENSGMSVIYCGIRDIPFINTMSSAWHIYRTIKEEHKKEKVDNIIFYNYKPEVAWAAYLAKKSLKIPITIEYEDGYQSVDTVRGLKAMIFKLTENIVSQTVNSAILVNSSISKQYPVPTVVVRGIVNTDFYDECKKFNKTANDKYMILYSGGLDSSRGINVLLDALDYLELDCSVVITGKGRLNSQDSRIDFKGFVTHEEVKHLMMQADLLIQCQLSNHRFATASFPSKLFEYISTGNLIISSDMEEVRSFAGDALIYYENDDGKELANAIMTAYNCRTEQELYTKLDELRHNNLPKEIGKNILEILE